MNEVAYRAILRQLGVVPSTSELTTAESPGLATRVGAFRRQLGDWTASGRVAVPLFGLPGVEVRPGSCIGCGEPLAEGRTWRCGPCLAAVNVVLGLAEVRDDEEQR
jgi:hypothetical protein